MAKNKARNRRAKLAKASQPAMIRRTLQKGDAKAALKQAKLCFRVDASHENRELLEEAYMARVEQLHRMKLVAEAKSVLAELVALEPSFSHVVERLPRMRLILGDAGADAESILNAEPALLTELVDQAVLDSGSEIPNIDDSRSQVMAVRAALLAVERGDDTVAGELLATIPRNSLLADWRLFTRGLIAFYRQDMTRANANWDRLAAPRPAKRIAMALREANRSQGASGMAEHEMSGAATGVLSRLNGYLRSDPVVSLLEKLAVAWRADRSAPFFRLLARFRALHFRSHEHLFRQMVDITWMRAARQGDHEDLDGLIEVAPGPLLDPQWHRARALVEENTDSFDERFDAATEWGRYVEEIDELVGVGDADRPIIKALVCQRFGQCLAENWREFRRIYRANGGPDELVDIKALERELDALGEEAVYAFRRSIKAYPDLQDAYFELAKLYEEREDDEHAAGVMKALAAHDPDCLAAALWLARHYLAQDDPAGSERYVRTVTRLRPRDPDTVNLGWNQALAMVRGLAIKRQFEAARTELTRAVGTVPPGVESYVLDVLRAAIEFKARNAEAANQHVKAALGKVEEPTPIWLLMSGNLARMRVAREYKKEFDDRFKKAIKRPVTSESAGHMAQFLFEMKIDKVRYTGLATQEKLFLKKLDRAARIEWREADLRQVCEFLDLLSRHDELHMELVEIGLEYFRDIPHYHYWCGMGETNKGPRLAQVEFALESLSHAIELHENGPVKLSLEQIAKARESLSLIKDYQERWADMGSLYHEDDFDEDDFDEDEARGPGLLEEGVGTVERVSDHDITRVIEAMPPEVRMALDLLAAGTGESIEDAVHAVLTSDVASASDGAGTQRSTKAGKKKTGKKKRRK